MARLSLRLMVMTSLSLHAIALLVCLLIWDRAPRGGGNTSGLDTGPVLILTKINPTPPPPPVAAPTATQPAQNRSPASKTDRQASHASPILKAASATHGGAHLKGGVVYVLDISGSMYEPYAGSTRLALARKFLERQFSSLPDGVPFAVVLYGETTRESGALVTANDDSRGAAVRFIGEDYDCGGGTNLPAGLVAAEGLAPSSVVVITDGDLNIANDQLLSEARSILGRPGPALSVYGIAPRSKTGDEQLLLHLVRAQAGTYQAMQAGGK